MHDIEAHAAQPTRPAPVERPPIPFPLPKQRSPTAAQDDVLDHYGRPSVIDLTD